MSQPFRLGLFLLATLAILAVGVFLVGRQESKFESNYRVRSEFQNVAGLNEGASVRVGGIHKGTVRTITLPKRPDGKVTVTMDLAKETENIVKKDSVASIQSEGLLGDKYVEISFGSVDAEKIKNGQTIQSEPPFDISDLFQKANQLLDSSRGAMQSIQGATENLNMITAKVNSGQGTAGKLINDPTLYQQASAGVTSLHEDADALKHNFLLRGFFNDRGYTNPEEIKKHQVSQIPKETPVKTFTFDGKDLFDKPDSAKLKNQKNLNAAGQFLKSQKFGLALIVAATGDKGDSDRQLVLSEARSYVVRKYLVDNFSVEDTRVRTMGAGKSATAGPDGNVQILVYAENVGATAPPDARKQGP
jgi:phospholipid/cholesterol/gamma-HCH transport system substrate-binding protein